LVGGGGGGAGTPFTDRFPKKVLTPSLVSILINFHTDSLPATDVKSNPDLDQSLRRKMFN